MKFKVSRVGEDTFLSQESKSRSQRLADIAAKWFFYIALTAGIGTFTVWMLIGGDIHCNILKKLTGIEPNTIRCWEQAS